jgi:hypothetical protein
MAGRRGPFLCEVFLRQVFFIYFFGASSLQRHMMYLILRSTSTGLEPSFHTTQEGLTKLDILAKDVVGVLVGDNEELLIMSQN